MRRRIDVDTRTEHAIVTERNWTDVEEDAVKVSEEPFSEMNVIAVVAFERRLQIKRVPGRSEQLGQHCFSDVEFIDAGPIEPLRQASRLTPVDDELLIPGHVQFALNHLFFFCHLLLPLFFF